MKMVLVIVAVSLLGGCAKEIHEASSQIIHPAAEPHGSVLAQTSMYTSDFSGSKEPSSTAAGVLLNARSVYPQQAKFQFRALQPQTEY